MSFEEQIMSKDKELSIFSPKMEAIVFITLQLFFQRAPGVLKIGEYSSRKRNISWIITRAVLVGLFSHVTRLGQSRARENIRDFISSAVDNVVGNIAQKMNLHLTY